MSNSNSNGATISEIPTAAVATETADQHEATAVATETADQHEATADAPEGKAGKKPRRDIAAAVAAASADVEDREENEKQKLAAAKRGKEALEKATKEYVALWAKRDAEDRAWMRDMGESTHSLLPFHFDREGWSEKTRTAALDTISAAVLEATGEDHRADISRCLAIYHVSQFFERKEHSKEQRALGSRFSQLPLNAQKGFALLVDREYTADSEGKPVEVYSIRNGPKIDKDEEEREDITDDVWLLLALTLSEAAAPDHLKGIKRVKAKGKGAAKDVGMAHGQPIFDLCTALRAYTFGKGVNPLTEKIPEKAAKEKPAAGTSGKSGEQPAAGGRPLGTEQLIRLDVKPALAAAGIVDALVHHDDDDKVLTALGKADEVDANFINGILMGMVEKKRVKELTKVCEFAMRALEMVKAKK